MLDALCTAANFNVAYAKMLIDDIPEADMAQPSGDLVNHPAWTVGHVLWAVGSARNLLGDATPAAQWALDSRAGTKPPPDRAAYPGKAELIATLESEYARATELLRAAPPERLAAPMPDERIRKVFPTIGEVVAFILTTHTATHLGQLSAWRRARGLGSVLRFG